VDIGSVIDGHGIMSIDHHREVSLDDLRTAILNVIDKSVF